MEAGQLTIRLTIEEIDEADDADGSGPVKWKSIGEVWAAVHPLRGVELIQAQQITNRVTHKVTIHYRSGIRPQQHRFKRVVDGSVLTIESALDLKSEHRWLECGCREEP